MTTPASRNYRSKSATQYTNNDISQFCKNLTPRELDDRQNSWIDDICEVKKTVSEQLPLIISAIEAQPVQYKHYLEICTTLEDVIRKRFPESDVYIRPYGSASTHLSFKNSDVDLFLDFSFLPQPPNILKKTLEDLIKAKKKVFPEMCIKKTRNPVIHCFHASGICCNISFSNALAVLNSELIRFYVSLDDRIRQFLLILKFWMKKQQLTGPYMLTSYALIILAIFYLQQSDSLTLPPVAFLQVKSSSTILISDWDTSFSRDKSLLRPFVEPVRVIDLLRGFFSFYSTFEFGMYVISPFYGKPVLKPRLANPTLLPKEFYMYKLNLLKDPSTRFDFVKPMCVQDPFNHGLNVTQNVSERDFARFREFCAVTADVCEEEIKNSGRESDFFRKLFKTIETSKRENRKNLITKYLGSHLFFDVKKTNFKEDSLRRFWGDEIFKIVVDVLKKVMKCRVRIKDEKNSGNGAIVLKEMECEMDHQLLAAARRNAAKQEFEFPDHLPVIEKEQMISEYLCDTVLKKEEKLSLDFKIFFFLKKDPTHVLMTLENLEKNPDRNKRVEETFFMLKTFIPKVIDFSFEHAFVSQKTLNGGI